MNDKRFSIKCDSDNCWDMVKDAREKVESLVSEMDEDLAYACKMVTSELIENALKYGSSVPNEKGVSYHLNILDNKIEIIVSNRIRSPDDLKTVTTYIDQIKKTRNPQELYKDRLMALMENSRQHQTRLGLYRIAYEGLFKMDYTFKNNLLTIIATRKF